MTPVVSPLAARVKGLVDSPGETLWAIVGMVAANAIPKAKRGEYFIERDWIGLFSILTQNLTQATFE
jgi:hypothetical protein